MNNLSQLIAYTPRIEQKISYTFADKNLLLLAFTHRSFVNENSEVSAHNERLEFLGDSVLGLLIAEYLYLTYPDTPEGDLSYLRSRLVEASSCVGFVQHLNVGKYLLMGKGERRNDGRGRDSILADLFEAIIGAIYLDGGIDAAKLFLFSTCDERIQATLKTPIENWKALLQDYCQRNYQTPPQYEVLEEVGPDHNKTFTIGVIIGDKKLGQGCGNSKKEAQQEAAKNACEQLGTKELKEK